MRVINALRARSQLGMILDDVSQGGVHYVIERLSRPLVVVVPFTEYQKIFRKELGISQGAELLQELASFRKKYGKQLSGTKGTTNLLHKIRAKRTQRLIHLVK